MSHDIPSSRASTGGPESPGGRPGAGTVCRDFLTGVAIALTGFMLIWAELDWLSVAGAFLSTAGALLMLITAVRAFSTKKT
jgi:hypothetical protein